MTLSKAHDVPARGQENDRVKRMESYVKDFKPIPMGTLNLKQGKGVLTLKALEIPAKPRWSSVADVEAGEVASTPKVQNAHGK